MICLILRYCGRNIKSFDKTSEDIFLQEEAEWDAWNTKKGMAQDEAKQKYAELAKQLSEKHGFNV